LDIDSTLTHFLSILSTYKYLRVPSVYTLKLLLTSMKLEKKILQIGKLQSRTCLAHRTSRNRQWLKEAKFRVKSWEASITKF